MNIFDRINDELLSLIDEKQNSYIETYIAQNLTIDSIITRRESSYINIIGKKCSGKTTLLNKLLASLYKISKHNAKIYLRHIKVIDSYNERETYEELITFYKNRINKSEIKILVIDDYNSFSKLFKSKVATLLKQRSGIHIAVIVGENSLNINNRHIDASNNGCLNTRHMLSGYIQELIQTRINSCSTREADILNYLSNNVIETDNIKTLLNNINILSYMDFNDPSGMYFYNNVVENVHIYNCLYGVGIDPENLILFLKDKYKNNENVKDTIVLIETSVFHILQSASIRSNRPLEIELRRILDTCYDVKNRLLHLKRRNQHISNKLFFNYFILKLGNLYI